MLSMQRRQLLLMTGTALTTILAGCSGSEDEGGGGDGEGDGSSEGSNNDSGGSGDENQSGEEEENSSNSSGEETESQDVTQRGAGEDVLENAGLVIQEHEYTEDDYSGYVEGIVENTTDESKDYVQVQVRGYDADGNQLDSYMDNTSNLQAGGTWAFEVPILDYEEMEEYDIAVTDSAL